RAGQEAAIEGLESGADDYLIKPFTTAELVARIRTHLTVARRRAEAAGRVAALAGVAQRLNAGLDPVVIGRILCQEIVPASAGGWRVWLSGADATDTDPDAGAPLPRCLHPAATDELPARARAALCLPPGTPSPGLLSSPLRARDKVIGAVALAEPKAAAS